MYIEASTPRQPGDEAKIETPGILFSGSSCVKFYYHMYGRDMGTLNVYVDGELVFSRTGNQGRRWKEAEIFIEERGVYPVGNWTCVVYSFIKLRFNKTTLILQFF